MLAFNLLLNFLAQGVEHVSCLPFISIDPESHTMIDEFGRTRIFHGMNAVEKIAPWYPIYDHFDSNDSLSARDAAQMKAWGWNAVRLGTMHPGIEPNRGEYDMDYLKHISNIIDILEAEDIYVLLDMHQDLFDRRYCGEGFPSWLTDACEANFPSDTPAFPAPVSSDTLPLDADGNPTLESCLETPFFDFYFAASVSSAFQCLYDNVDGVQDAMASAWSFVAKTFADRPSVLGFDLLNEPWAGDIYNNHKNLLIPGWTDLHNLQPMYAKIFDAIAAVDDVHIIFYESVTYDLWPMGFDSTPGGPDADHRQAISYHIYCPFGAGGDDDADGDSNATNVVRTAGVHDATLEGGEGIIGCELWDSEFTAMRQYDVNRLGGGWMLTEFGALPDTTPADLVHLQQVAQVADDHLQSWMYWSYKSFNDVTTINNGLQALYQAGTLSEKKLQVLQRNYAPIVAGKLTRMQTDDDGRNSLELDFSFTSNQVNQDELSSQSSIYFAGSHLSHVFGVKVTVEPANAVFVSGCDGNYFYSLLTIRRGVRDKAAHRLNLFYISSSSLPLPSSSLWMVSSSTWHNERLISGVLVIPSNSSSPLMNSIFEVSCSCPKILAIVAATELTTFTSLCASVSHTNDSSNS